MRPRPDRAERWRPPREISERSFSYIVDFVLEPEVCALERSRFPSRAGASGSHHLPWALPRILQFIPKIKRRVDAGVARVGIGDAVEAYNTSAGVPD